MKTSVSTSMSATVPFISARHGGAGCCSERCRKRHDRIGMLALQVDVEGAADDLGHRYAFGFSEGVDSFALFIGQINLGTSC